VRGFRALGFKNKRKRGRVTVRFERERGCRVGGRERGREKNKERKEKEKERKEETKKK